MPVNTIRKPHGPFQIDAISDFGLIEYGRVKRFRRYVYLKTSILNYYSRQTGPTDGYAVADFGLIQRKIRFNGHPVPLA